MNANLKRQLAAFASHGKSVTSGLGLVFAVALVLCAIELVSEEDWYQDIFRGNHSSLREAIGGPNPFTLD